MSKIKNVNLQFSCPVNRYEIRKTDNEYICDNCSRKVIDFTIKSDEELKKAMSESPDTICGIFRHEQLSRKFIKYAAATVIATTSFTMEGNGQNSSPIDSTLQEIEISEEEEEFIDCEFFGSIIDVQAEPVDGYKKFYEELSDSINMPNTLAKKGKVFIQFTVDTLGKASDFKVIKGFDEIADQEALRAIKALGFPFKTGSQRGKPVNTRLVIPIIFDPKDHTKE